MIWQLFLSYSGAIGLKKGDIISQIYCHREPISGSAGDHVLWTRLSQGERSRFYIGQSAMVNHIIIIFMILVMFRIYDFDKGSKVNSEPQLN